MTKITFISDTHELHRAVKIETTDILIHTGDITNLGSYDVLRDFNKWLGEQPASQIVFIAGNHDLTYQTKPRLTKKIVTNAIYLENNSITLQGLKIWGSPVTPNFYNWAFNMGGDERQCLWEEIPNDTDVVLVHGPPLFTLDKNMYGESCGCGYLGARMQIIKPKICAFGHIHPSYGTITKHDTIFVNSSQVNESASEIINKPIVIEI